MRWSLPAGRILGIQIRVHVTFLLFVAWIAILQGVTRGSAAHAFAAAVLLVLVFGCVLLHELGHAMAARRYGIRTRDIVLLPIGGIARLERMPENPAQEIVVALAGPAVNVVIAAVLWLAGSPRPTFDAGAALGSDLVTGLLVINIIMVVFNLIPAFPMDGGRVLRASLAFVMPFARATRVAARVGQAVAVAFAIYGLVQGMPMLIFVALFVFVAAGEERAVVETRSTLEGVAVGDAMVVEFRAVAENDTLGQVIDYLIAGSQQDFPVVDGGGRVRGVLTRNDLVLALQKGGAGQRIAEVVTPDGPTADAAEPLEAALQRMREKGRTSMPVVEGGRLVGLLTVENVSDLLLVRNALEKHAGAG